jgi:hypothetical protein
MFDQFTYKSTRMLPAAHAVAGQHAGCLCSGTGTNIVRVFRILSERKYMTNTRRSTKMTQKRLKENNCLLHVSLRDLFVEKKECNCFHDFIFTAKTQRGREYCFFAPLRLSGGNNLHGIFTGERVIMPPGRMRNNAAGWGTVPTIYTTGKDYPISAVLLQC